MHCFLTAMHCVFSLQCTVFSLTAMHCFLIAINCVFHRNTLSHCNALCFLTAMHCVFSLQCTVFSHRVRYYPELPDCLIGMHCISSLECIVFSHRNALCFFTAMHCFFTAVHCAFSLTSGITQDCQAASGPSRSLRKACMWSRRCTLRASAWWRCSTTA